MTVPERMVVSATVKSRAEEEDGFTLELEVPGFRSQYPTRVSRVPEAVAKLLPPRAEPYMVVLLRENPQKRKSGEPYSGDLPWHYYWGLEGLATVAETAAEVAELDPLEEREHRIMRSTALAQAVAFIGQYTPGANPTLDNDIQLVLGVAAEFYAWLRDGPQDGQGVASDPAPTPTTTHKAPAKPSAKSAAPPVAGTPLVTREEVIAWAKDNGYPTLQDMAAVPGVTLAMRENRFHDAFALLERGIIGAEPSSTDSII